MGIFVGGGGTFVLCVVLAIVLFAAYALWLGLTTPPCYPPLTFHHTPTHPTQICPYDMGLLYRHQHQERVSWDGARHEGFCEEAGGCGEAHVLRRAGVGAGGETGWYGRGVWDYGRGMQVSKEQLGRPRGLVSRRLVLVSVPSFGEASTEDHILRWEVLP